MAKARLNAYTTAQTRPGSYENEQRRPDLADVHTGGEKIGKAVLREIGTDLRTRSVDVRVIAATNRDLRAEVQAGRFRSDLYFRLGVFLIEVPPLRERQEDIGLPAEHFLRESARNLGLPVPTLGERDLRLLKDYEWPGNVRELEHVIARAMILSRRGPFRLDVPVPRMPAPRSGSPAELSAPPALQGWEAQERAILEAALTATHWKVYGRDGADARLGLPPTTVASKMKRLGLKRPR